MHVALVPSPLGEAYVSTWAPNASSPQAAVAAEQSFRRAVEANMSSLRRLAHAMATRRPRMRGN